MMHVETHENNESDITRGINIMKMIFLANGFFGQSSLDHSLIRHVFRKNLLKAVLLLCAICTGQTALAQSFNKTFSPTSIAVGGESRLTLVINNSSIGMLVSDVAVVDILPAGMTIAAVPNLAVDQCTLQPTGAITAPANGNALSVSGVSIGAGGVCTISVNVTVPVLSSTPPVMLTSTTGDLTTSFGNQGTATATLTIADDRPSISQAFSPSSVSVGDRSRLTFTIDNTANATAAGQITFTNELPTGLQVASPANAVNNCTNAPFQGTEFSAEAGSNQIALGGFQFAASAVAGGATCTVGVDVVATGPGMLNSITSNMTSGTATSPTFPFVGFPLKDSGFASATLMSSVTQLSIIQSFINDPVAPGNAAELEFTLANTNREFDASNVSFTNDLTTITPMLPGISISSVLANSCGGSVIGVGGTTIGLTGGTLPAGGSCTVRVSLDIPLATAAGVYSSTTSAVTAMINGDISTGNMASDSLNVEPVPILTMEFLDATTLTPDPVVQAGDDVVIRYTVTNTSATSGATDITFVDELTGALVSKGFLPFPLTLSLPSAPCGTGSLVSPAFIDTGRQGIMLTNGNLSAAPGAGSSCTFDATLTIPEGFNVGMFSSTTEPVMATVDGATSIGNTSTDDLTVIAAPTLQAAFTDSPVVPGGIANLEFTLSYSENAVADATNVGFELAFANIMPATDVPTVSGLPLSGVCDPDGSGGAPGTGTLIGSAGNTMLTLDGVSLSPGQSCVISVPVNIANTTEANTYTVTTSEVSAMVNTVAVTSPASSASLDVGNLIFTTEFLPSTVLRGEAFVLRYNLQNLAADSATSISFTNSLFAVAGGLEATDPVLSDTCGGIMSIVSIPALGSSLTYSSGALGSGVSCNIDVEVTTVNASAPDGQFNNTTSQLSYMLNGNPAFSPAANSNLVMQSDNRILLTKAFTDDPVVAGSQTTLVYTLTNPDPIKTFSSISFTDMVSDILPGMSIDSTSVSPNCSAAAGSAPDTSGSTGGSFAVSGLVLEPAGACTITTVLNVPANTSTGSFPSTTSVVTSAFGTISGLINDPANDTLEVVAFDVDFSKQFGVGVVRPGDTTTLEFTLTNNDASEIERVSFSEDLEALIPGLTAIGLPQANVCGAGSSLVGTSQLTLVSGNLPPNGSCTFSVTLLVPESSPLGTFTSTSSELSANALNIGSSAVADLTISPLLPEFSQAFVPDIIGVNQTSTLTFTIDNSSSVAAATTLDFTNSLPTGLIIATPFNGNSTCAGGTVTAVAGSSSISYSGGSVAASSSCAVSVDVTSSLPATYGNTTGDLTSSAGNSGTANDTLTVLGATFTKKFEDTSPIRAGDSVVLNFSITNNSATDTLDDLVFTDNLGAVFYALAATDLPKNGVCGSSSVLTSSSSSVTQTANLTSTTSGTRANGAAALNQLSLTGGSLAPGETCRFSTTLSVPASTAPGTYTNTTSGLFADVVPVSPAAVDELTISATEPVFTKAFTPTSIQIGEVSRLTFIVDNTASPVSATGLSFADTFPTGLKVATPANVLNSCSGLAVAINDSGSVTLTGGSVAANSTCTLSVDTTSLADGEYVNTTGNLASSSGNSGTATATLVVDSSSNPVPGFSKAFSPSEIEEGEISTLTFTIDNSGASLDVSSLSFTDNFPSGLRIAAANVLNTCGGVVTVVNNGTSVALSGGTVRRGATCSIRVDTTSMVQGTYENTSGDLTSVLGNSGTATATLIVSNDRDGDGVSNDMDNCPSDANADQADLDLDGQGNACDLDDDGDGMPDQYEIENGLDPLNSFDQQADPDGDGFSNIDEFRFGTDPNVPNLDDDNNGIPDEVDRRRMRAIVPSILFPLLLDDA